MLFGSGCGLHSCSNFKVSLPLEGEKGRGGLRNLRTYNYGNCSRKQHAKRSRHIFCFAESNSSQYLSLPCNMAYIQWTQYDTEGKANPSSINAVSTLQAPVASPRSFFRNQIPQRKVVNNIFHFLDPVLDPIASLPENIIFQVKDLESRVHIFDELANYKRSSVVT